MQKKKFVCNCEGCECYHCRECGHHYEPSCDRTARQGTCDGCQLDLIDAQTEQVTAAFGGDYEKAAQVMGW